MPKAFMTLHANLHERQSALTQFVSGPQFDKIHSIYWCRYSMFLMLWAVSPSTTLHWMGVEDLSSTDLVFGLWYANLLALDRPYDQSVRTVVKTYFCYWQGVVVTELWSGIYKENQGDSAHWSAQRQSIRLRVWAFPGSFYHNKKISYKHGRIWTRTLRLLRVAISVCDCVLCSLCGSRADSWSDVRRLHEGCSADVLLWLSLLDHHAGEDS